MDRGLWETCTPLGLQLELDGKPGVVQEVGFHPHKMSKAEGESIPGVSELFSYPTYDTSDLQLLSTADPWAASLLVEDDEVSFQTFL